MYSCIKSFQFNCLCNKFLFVLCWNLDVVALDSLEDDCCCCWGRLFGVLSSSWKTDCRARVVLERHVSMGKVAFCWIVTAFAFQTSKSIASCRSLPSVVSKANQHIHQLCFHHIIEWRWSSWRRWSEWLLLWLLKRLNDTPMLVLLLLVLIGCWFVSEKVYNKHWLMKIVCVCVCVEITHIVYWLLWGKWRRLKPVILLPCV